MGLIRKLFQGDVVQSIEPEAQRRGALRPVRERIELRELSERAVLAWIVAGSTATLGTMLAVVALLSFVPGWAGMLAGVALTAVTATVAIVALRAGLARVPVTYVLELSSGPSGLSASLRHPNGALAGRTDDGSLVIRPARYPVRTTRGDGVPASRGGGAFRAALVLESRGEALGALSTFGITSFPDEVVVIAAPRLGNLRPLEFEHLRQLIRE